jgi:hypothetical protein
VARRTRRASIVAAARAGDSLSNYRFAFADLFLKRAFFLDFARSVAFGLYVFVAAPLLHYHETHDRNDVMPSVFY